MALRHTCGVKNVPECRKLHQIFGERWRGRPTCVLEDGEGCPIRTRLLSGLHGEPDPIAVDRLVRTRSLRRLTRIKPNTLGVRPSLCPIYNVKVYVPCSRKSCLFWLDNLPYYLNCGFRFAETVALRGWTPSRSFRRLAAALGRPTYQMRRRLRRVLDQLARFYFRDYVATHREAYRREVRACYFCLRSSGVYYSEESKLYVCPTCDPLPARIRRDLKRLEREYQAPPAVVIHAAWDLFHGQVPMVVSVLELKPATWNEVSTRLRLEESPKC